MHRYECCKVCMTRSIERNRSAHQPATHSLAYHIGGRAMPMKANWHIRLIGVRGGERIGRKLLPSVSRGIDEAERSRRRCRESRRGGMVGGPEEMNLALRSCGAVTPLSEEMETPLIDDSKATCSSLIWVSYRGQCRACVLGVS